MLWVVGSCQKMLRMCQELSVSARRYHEAPEVTRGCQVLPGVPRGFRRHQGLSAVFKSRSGVVRNCQDVPGVIRSFFELSGHTRVARDC